MPFYEYKCMECDTITEVLRSIKSRDYMTYCAKCGAKAIRIMSRFNTVEPVREQNPRKILDTDPTCKPRGTGVRLEGGSATFKDCDFHNLQTGISIAKGSKLNIDGNKFANVVRPIEVTDE